MDLKFSAVTRPVERLMATAQNGLEVLRLGGLETGSTPSPSCTPLGWIPGSSTSAHPIGSRVVCAGIWPTTSLRLARRLT